MRSRALSFALSIEERVGFIEGEATGLADQLGRRHIVVIEEGPATAARVASLLRFERGQRT